MKRRQGYRFADAQASLICTPFSYKEEQAMTIWEYADSIPEGETI